MRLSLIIAALTLLTVNLQIENSQSRVDPLVLTLLKTTADSDFEHKSTFFQTLHQLARRAGYPADTVTNYDSGEDAHGGRSRAMLTKGRAISLVSGELRFVIVILGTHPFSVPGVEAQKILLLDETGKIRDQVSCGINTRYGSLITEFPSKPQDDNAQIVIRFVPTGPGVWHNWHTINHEGKSHTFYVLGNRDPEELTRLGLVRLEVRDRKFGVIFPDLTDRKSSAKPLMEHVKKLNPKSRTYVSSDGARWAKIMPVSETCVESRIEIRKRSGLLLRRSFASPDCEHGMGVERGAWTSDARFFVFNAQSTGGHQPWHWPIYFYSRRDNKLHDLDKYIGPIVAPEFSLTGQHRIETRVLEMGNDNGRPIRVDLNRIGKRTPRP